MSAKQAEPAPAADGRVGSGRLKALVVVLGLLLVGVAAFFIWRGVQQDAQARVWDEYYQLRKENEPRQDPLWNDLYGVFGAQRDRYTRALDAFLASDAAEGGKTLEADVRWRLAKTLTDHVLSQRDLTDASKRRVYYDRALAEMQKIRDDFPDFPLNWDLWKPDRFPSLTRKFIHWLEENRDWEAKYLPRPRDPDGAETIVFRTTAGDIRWKLYEKGNDAWAEGFLGRAAAGAYDGTALFEKREIGDLAEPREHAVRCGSPESRGRVPYAPEDHLKLAGDPRGGGLLPGEARNEIPCRRGIVVAWHDGATEYDDPVQLMFVVHDSPQFDYEYTPVGKVLDEVSLATLDAVFGRQTWRTDPKVKEDTGELRKVLDFFQAPVVIRKVLVYDAEGALVEPEETAPTKAEVAPDEQSLSSLKPDAYKVPEPKRPEPKEPGEDGDGGGNGNGAGDGK